MASQVEGEIKLCRFCFTLLLIVSFVTYAQNETKKKINYNKMDVFLKIPQER